MAIDAQAKGISDRDVATEDRIEVLNTLYRILIKYAGIGQDIFYETDEAKYNDYVIYDTPVDCRRRPHYHQLNSEYNFPQLICFIGDPADFISRIFFCN